MVVIEGFKFKRNLFSRKLCPVWRVFAGLAGNGRLFLHSRALKDDMVAVDARAGQGNSCTAITGTFLLSRRRIRVFWDGVVITE